MSLPGPWTVRLGTNAYEVRQRIMGWDYVLFEVKFDPDTHRSDLVAKGIAENAARSVNAMPEMLEALKSIENDGGRIPAPIWAMRNAAIAKAGGATT